MPASLEFCGPTNIVILVITIFSCNDYSKCRAPMDTWNGVLYLSHVVYMFADWGSNRDPGISPAGM